MGAASLRFIARRACRLVGDLAQRGHAAVTPLAAATDLSTPINDEPRMARLLDELRHVPRWADDDHAARRERTRRALSDLLRGELGARLAIG